MPLIERTGADFYQPWQLDRDNVSAEERAERWVSHSALEWGDYLGGSSDIQVANARDLPDEIGVADGSDVIRVERGGYGYERHWVRLDPAPTAEEWNGYDERHDESLAEQWEAHVRERLGSLDNYPLFNDETSSQVLEEWAEAGWKDWGRSDLRRTVAKADDDFAEWCDERELFDWDKLSELRDRFNFDPWHAEGGDGGVYFDVDAIARVFIPAHLVAYCDAEVSTWEQHPAAAILAGGSKATAERRGGSWQFMGEVLAEAIRHSFPKWNERPARLDEMKQLRKYDDDSLRVFADALEEADTASPWPAFLRDYAALPAATPEVAT